MPITERTLVKLANREDIGPGVKRWRVDGLDSAGRRWIHGPFFGVEADAERVRDTCWPLEAIKRQDILNGLDAVRRGTDPADVVRSDLTDDEWRDAVVRKFAKTKQDENHMFLLNAASFIAGFTEQEVGKEVRDRAIAIRDVLKPAVEADRERSRLSAVTVERSR